MAIRIETGGEPIPGYRLIDRLGGGGFGEVWKVEAPGGILKAIKFVYGDLQTEDEDGVRRAEQELKALKRVKSVRHPYLLSLERYDIIDSRLLIVMELADRNLWDRFRECRSQGLPGVPREELLRYMEEAAEVLDLMNSEYQLQHLDIKPQNLFLVHNHVKVADFGLVKDLEGVSTTVTGGVTPVYAAPETFDGVVSRFCDQYSLAIVYQELLTGQRPFMGTNVQQLIMQHLAGSPNLSSLPPNDRAVIARALSKKAEERHPGCADMIRALRRAGAAAARGLAPAESANAAEVDSEAPTRAYPDSPAWSPAASVPVELPAQQRREPVGRGAVPLRQPAGRGLAPARPLASQNRPRTSGEIVAPPLEMRKPTREAPPELVGEGLLFPAVVIGLGGVGRDVVQRLRANLYDRFGSLRAVPHLRCLYLDTDADSVQEAMQQAPLGSAWDPHQILLARVNRPSHYLKPVGGRVRLDTWLDLKLLYRIPRNPGTTGLRALGRLAFFDNYRLIAGRLQEELEACTAPEALATADKETGLGLRSNRPRVYLVTSLAGGTGSGMFLDLAYVTRTVVKQLGYAQPEVVGVLLLPPVEPSAPRTQPLVNAYAALTEWNHFSAGGNVFTTRYDERDPVLADADRPFERAIVLPLEAGASPTGKAVALAGDFLYRELATTLGRTADVRRPPAPVRLVAQTFGLYRFCWPRQALLQRSGSLLVQRLVQSWAAPETPALQAAVQTWVIEQWAKQDLGPEPLIEQLQHACGLALGQAPEDTFMAVLEPLIPRGRRPAELTPPAVVAVLARFEEILGKPDDAAAGPHGQSLADILNRETDQLIATCRQKVAQLSKCLIDQPDYRVAGAEEAMRQIDSALQQALEVHERLFKELSDQASAARERIDFLLGQLQANPGGRRTTALSTDLLEALRLYPKWAYQSQVLRRIIMVYNRLRAQLGEQVREVDFCRQRLVELRESFVGLAAAGSHKQHEDLGRYLLPGASRSPEQAIERLLAGVTPEQMKELDRSVQALVQQQFTGLLQVCMSKSTFFRNLQLALQQHAEAFLGERVGGADVVEMFLAKYSQEGEATQALAEAYLGAAPDLADVGQSGDREIAILGLPAGDHARQVGELARHAVGGTRLLLAESPDEIVFYREQPYVPIHDLPQLGPIARDAYREILASENSTPHSRTDISQWLAIEPD